MEMRLSHQLPFQIRDQIHRLTGAETPPNALFLSRDAWRLLLSMSSPIEFDYRSEDPADPTTWTKPRTYRGLTIYVVPAMPGETFAVGLVDENKTRAVFQ